MEQQLGRQLQSLQSETSYNQPPRDDASGLGASTGRYSPLFYDMNGRSSPTFFAKTAICSTPGQDDSYGESRTCVVLLIASKDKEYHPVEVSFEI